MSTDNRFMIRNLQKLEQFYTITSRATNLTWAQCDETTFDDQAYLFSREQDAADFCKALNEDNYPAVTVNRVAFHNGAGIAYLPLEQIVTLRKPEQNAKTPPVSNTALQLTGIYFLHTVSLLCGYFSIVSQSFFC